MAFTKDNQYLIAICHGSFEDTEKEIRVYDLINNNHKSYSFNDPIDGYKIDTLSLLDLHEPYIALGCRVKDKQGYPILLFNYQNGNQKWLTSSTYLPYLARFSPNGETLLVYGRDSQSETKLDSKFTFIEIN